jgi:DNA-binding SARP family transcriptional activator
MMMRAENVPLYGTLDRARTTALSMARTLASVRDAPPQLAISFFGQASVRLHGVPVKFAKRNTTIALLARVILQRGKALSRESLAYALFPDDDEATALAQLRRYLYLASKALPARTGEPWLIVDAETVRWNDAAGAWIDVFAFEELARDPPTHAAAIDLYAGDVLEDNYDEWVVSERERLRTLYLAILVESLDRFRSQREFASALSCAKRILHEDPWREDTLRSVLAIRYESGDSAGALAEYERFAKQLRDELGAVPMPETLAVRQSIIANAPLPASPRVSEAPIAIPRTTSILPFIGRDADVAVFRTAWARAASGTGTLMFLTGEAGVGKSRLCAELARSVESEGGRVFVGTTAVPESAPYQAFVEALRSALPMLVVRPPTATRRAVLGHILPELRESEAATANLPDRGAANAIAQLHDALCDAIRRIASPRPLLLILEDLHWAGTATIEALGEVIKDLLRAPVLIVATCRNEQMTVDHPLRTLLRSLVTLPNVGEHELERFSAADVAQLVLRIDALRDRPATIAADLYARSEGNALFLNELIADVMETGNVGAPSDRSIAELVAVRTAQLGEDALIVAQIAAVAGSGCSVSLTREVSNISASQVAVGFDELLDRRILRQAGARMHHDYVFTHHLIAEAVYAEIDLAFRAQCHARIARVLEANIRARLPASAREIAWHHERAGDREAAAMWYVTAASDASSVHAYADAVALASLAIALSPPVNVLHDALDIRERANGRRGDRVRQREDIDHLERLAGSDARARFDVLTRRALLERTLGESDAEGRIIADMAILAESLGDAEKGAR